jgi:outer membrane lipoprotein LolB
VSRAQLIAGFAVFFLSGCAAVAPRPGIERPAGETVQGLPDAFELTGRIAVRHDDQGFSGGLRWQHRPGTDVILVLTPLGQAVARITREPGEARLESGEGDPQRAPDAETLTERVLGWRLPVSGLQYWVLGSNSPAASSVVEFDADGRLVRLTQDGWDIEYLRYTETDARPLPRTVAMRRGSLSIRLNVDEWNLVASGP